MQAGMSTLQCGGLHVATMHDTMHDLSLVNPRHPKSTQVNDIRSAASLQGTVRPAIHIELVDLSVAVLPTSRNIPVVSTNPLLSDAGFNPSGSLILPQIPPESLLISGLHASLYPGRVTSVIGPTKAKRALVNALSGELTSSRSSETM